MPATLALAGLLCIAGWHDVQSRRIPNVLVLVGMTVGLLFQAMASGGGGFFHPTAPGALGLVSGVSGLLLGLGLFMPFYLLRVLGAGDVKLLAMVGAWVGAGSIAWVALWTMAAGGVLSIVAMLASGQTSGVIANLRRILSGIHVVKLDVLRSGRGPQATPTSPGLGTTGRIPYALAIAAGTAVEAGRHWL